MTERGSAVDGKVQLYVHTYVLQGRKLEKSVGSCKFDINFPHL